MSPSARKVWIEIAYPLLGKPRGGCHLPRGRCGLKSEIEGVSEKQIAYVTFRKEGVD